MRDEQRESTRCAQDFPILWKHAISARLSISMCSEQWVKNPKHQHRHTRDAATLCTPLYDKSVNVLLTIAEYLTPFNSQRAKQNKTKQNRNTRTIAFGCVQHKQYFTYTHIHACLCAISDLSDGKHLKILNWILVHRTSSLLPLSLGVCVVCCVICVKCLLLWNALKIYHSIGRSFSRSHPLLPSYISLVQFQEHFHHRFPSITLSLTHLLGACVWGEDRGMVRCFQFALLARFSRTAILGMGTHTAPRFHSIWNMFPILFGGISHFASSVTSFILGKRVSNTREILHGSCWVCALYGVNHLFNQIFRRYWNIKCFRLSLLSFYEWHQIGCSRHFFNKYVCAACVCIVCV